MRITLEKGYTIQSKVEPKKFLNDSEEFVELPQFFATRSVAVQTKNISSFGDKCKIVGVEKVIIVES